MRALVSGQAASAVVQIKRGYMQFIYGADEPKSAGLELMRIFDGCSDVREVEISSIDEIDQLLERAWSVDRCLKLFLLMLDPTEPWEDKIEYADCVEDFLQNFDTQQVVKRILTSKSLCSTAEATEIFVSFVDKINLHALIDEILRYQTSIEIVDDALNEAILENHSDRDHPNEIKGVIVSDGSFYEVLSAVQNNTDMNFPKLSIVSKHRKYANIITSWIAKLAPGLKKASSIPRESIEAQVSDEDDWAQGEEIQPSYAAFNSVKLQQQAIASKLKQCDLESARRMAAALVTSQHGRSSAEQIAKSLSAIAQQAKKYDLSDLQLEWSEQATETNPYDPRTFGHFADALINVGRYGEAMRALDSVEQAGDPVYAATGRARILRSKGQLQEAREAFLAAADTYRDMPGFEFALIGAADVLREMGASDGAAVEYTRLSEMFPLEPCVWTGMASALVDLGKFDQAVATFRRSPSVRSSLDAEIGQAAILRKSGRFSEALQIYQHIIEQYPTNIAALCGLAKIASDNGNFSAALDNYDKAISINPYTAFPFIAKGRLLTSLCRWSEAEVLYQNACQKFPYERALLLGKVYLLRDQGKYQAALREADILHQKFSFDVQISIARASLLFRIGSNSDAISAYDLVLEKRPYSLSALIGKASVLIKIGKYREAIEILPIKTPKTMTEWKVLLLRALIDKRKNDLTSSRQRLIFGIQKCPFVLVRTMFRTALVSLELSCGQKSEAQRIVQNAPGEISNVVALHVLAANRQQSQMKELAKVIRTQFAHTEVIRLADEIMKSRKQTGDASRSSLVWITDQEENLILRAVA